jgi:hypothetical protein
MATDTLAFAQSEYLNPRKLLATSKFQSKHRMCGGAIIATAGAISQSGPAGRFFINALTFWTG